MAKMPHIFLTTTDIPTTMNNTANVLWTCAVPIASNGNLVPFVNLGLLTYPLFNQIKLEEKKCVAK
jgi:hypothetical protein